MSAPTGKGNCRYLTLVALAEAKRLPPIFLKELGLHDLSAGGVGIPYYDVDGSDIAVKKRTALRAKEGSYWPKDVPLAAYGQWRIGDANKAGFLILVEGESDCWVLWHHGLPALGIPGALKTPAWRHATDYLFTLQERLDLQFKRDVAQYLKANEKWEAAVAAAKKPSFRAQRNYGASAFVKRTATVLPPKPPRRGQLV